MKSEGAVRRLRISRKDAKIYYGSLFAIELILSLCLGALSEAGESIITIPAPASTPHAPTGLSELRYATTASLSPYIPAQTVAGLAGKSDARSTVTGANKNE